MVFAWAAAVIVLLALGVARADPEEAGAAQTAGVAVGTTIAALVIGWVIWAVISRVRRRKPLNRAWIPAIAVLVGVLSTAATLGSDA